MSYHQTGNHWNTQPPRKRTSPWTWVAAVIVGLMVLCGFMVLIGALAGPGTEPDPAPTRTVTVRPTSPVPSQPSSSPTPGRTTPAPAPSTPPPTVPAEPVSLEDGIYHVGEDIDAGTYRLAEPITADDWCYWRKSKDAEGSDIIDNDLASAGRLQVTLKKGQWFETQRCGTWVRK